LYTIKISFNVAHYFSVGESVIQMMNITIVPSNIFNLGKFEVRIKASYDKITTKYHGDIKVARYLLYTPYKKGWRICQATWDKRTFTLPRLDFFYLNEMGVCVPAAGKVDDDTKRVIATLCDSYDKQVTMARINGHRHQTVEELLNAPFDNNKVEETAETTNESAETENNIPEFQEVVVQ